MDASSSIAKQRRRSELIGVVLRTQSSSRAQDGALVAVRIALGWIFTYYGAGKLFGAFNGPGIHRTAIYFSTTAHLHPGGFFAVFGGIIELGGAVAMFLGVGSRFAGAALFGDQVMAMITVTWANGINSLTNTPGYEFNITLATLALVITLLGAGRFSADHLIVQKWFVPSRSSNGLNSATSDSATRSVSDPQSPDESALSSSSP